MGLKPGKHHYLLLIFFLVLVCRLFYAFQTPYFSNNDDYFTSRQVENIMETGMPIVYDELSYSGRTYTGSPAFYYILALFNFVMPLAMVSKIVINIFASLLVIIVYLTANELTNNKNAALFSAFISGFIPIFFKTTFNSLSIYALVFPLLFFCLYCFLKIQQPGYIYFYLISLFLLTLLSPIVILLLVGFVFYIFLLKIDRMNQSRAELEVILFSIFFVIWFLFIIYKNAFLFHGYSVIWQNVPKEVLKNYFGGITILGAIYQIGSIPLLYATYVVLQHIYKPKYRTACLFSGFAFSTVLLLWLRLIEPYIGLIFLGIISVLLFAQFYKWSFQYWKHTHFAKLRYILFLSFFFPLILTSVLPSLSYADQAVINTINDDEIAVLKWINKNTNKKTTILAPVSEGHLITGIAKRKNIADDNFILAPDAEERLLDVEKIYTALFETEAIGLLSKYDVSYILLTPEAKKRFGILELVYASDSKCFSLVYNKTTKVYESRCELKVL